MKMRIFSAALLLALLLTAASASADITVEAPSDAEIGQPFTVSVIVSGESLSDVKIAWQGKEAGLAPREDGNYSALLGTDLKNAKAGKSELKISFRSNGGAEESISHMINLASHKYPVEKLTVPPSKVTPPKEQAERIAREANLGRSAIQSDSAGSAPKLPLARPVPGSYSSVYGKSRYFNGEFRGRHGGVDMRAAVGTPVKAAAEGVVVLAGENFWFAGNCIYIDHGAGFVTFYGHLSKINVKKGERVKAGDIIALSGKTGRVTGPHLHFSTVWRGEYFDPAPLLAD